MWLVIYYKDGEAVASGDQPDEDAAWNQVWLASQVGLAARVFDPIGVPVYYPAYH